MGSWGYVGTSIVLVQSAKCIFLHRKCTKIYSNYSYFQPRCRHSPSVAAHPEKPSGTPFSTSTTLGGQGVPAQGLPIKKKQSAQLSASGSQKSAPSKQKTSDTRGRGLSSRDSYDERWERILGAARGMDGSGGLREQQGAPSKILKIK